MTNLPLNLAVERYERAIAALENSGEQVSADTILAVLVARADVHSALHYRTRFTPRGLMRETYEILIGKPKVSRRCLVNLIRRLDARLSQQASTVNQAINLDDWKMLLHSPERDWLSLLEPRKSLSWNERFDWLWKLFSAIFFGLSLPFFFDIFKRCFTGGIDTGSGVAVLTAGALSLLSGGSGLTQLGKTGSDRIFASLNVPKQWRDEIRCALSFSCLILLFLAWSQLHHFAGWWVAQAQQKADPPIQQAYYSRAIALDPNSFDAHFSLGKLYEKQRQFEQALEEYKAANNAANQADQKKQARDHILAISSTYSTLREFDKALVEYKSLWLELGEDHKERSTIAGLIADMYLQQPDYAQADHWLYQSVKNQLQQGTYQIRPEQFDLIKKLGRTYMEQRNFPHAVKWFAIGHKGTTQIPAQNYEALYYLGWVNLNRGAYSNASSYLDLAIQTDVKHLKGEHAPAHCLMATVLSQQPKQSQANQKYILQKELKQCADLISAKTNHTADEAEWLINVSKIQEQQSNPLNPA